MSQRDSIVFKLEGVDDKEPRLVARADLIHVFSAMCQHDLLHSHSVLLHLGIGVKPESNTHYMDMEARDLIALLEQHTRAVNALQALLALRDPDELVEAFMS
jgi:hypothetical protein